MLPLELIYFQGVKKISSPPKKREHSTSWANTTILFIWKFPLGKGKDDVIERRNKHLLTAVSLSVANGVLGQHEL